MYEPQSLIIQHKTQQDDDIGGFKEAWSDLKTVPGYIDLLQGTDENTVQQAFMEQSTHIAVIPEYVPGITDKMRVVDEDRRFYEVTYSDNPVGVGHHLELYLNFGGVLDG